MIDLASVLPGDPRVIHRDAMSMVIHARWEDVAGALPNVNATIADPPYGKRTHAGHDAGVDRSKGDGSRKQVTARRRRLQYSCWGTTEVAKAARVWCGMTSGWVCAMSCSDLFGAWRERFEAAGRTAFAPVPCVINAMSVRLSGDGPSNWAVYLNVSRPKSLIDGTLNGAYVVNRNPGHIGGKPLALMESIVLDYTSVGDLVWDPCAGEGTTIVACRMHGRQGIAVESDRETCEKAARRIAGTREQLAMRLDCDTLTGKQEAMDL